MHPSARSSQPRSFQKPILGHNHTVSLHCLFPSPWSGFGPTLISGSNSGAVPCPCIKIAIDLSETLNIVKIIKMQIQFCCCFEYLISDECNAPNALGCKQRPKKNLPEITNYI